MKALAVGSRVTFVLGREYYFGTVRSFMGLHDVVTAVYDDGLLMRARGTAFESRELLKSEGIYWTRGWSRRAGEAMLAARALA